MEIRSGKKLGPRRVLLYGTAAIGKSTWAAQWPAPIFLNLEDGLDDIDCASTPWLTSFHEVVEAVGWLLSNENPFQTVVIDSADWLESLIFKQVAQDAGKETVEQIGYGKGYQTAADKLDYLIRGLDQLRIKQNKHIVFLAHEQITKFAAPGGDSYDRYSPAIHKEMSAVLVEWCQEVLFASYKVYTKTEDQGFNKVRKVAIGGQERFIRTTENAAIVAKNRLNLPEEIPMSFAEFAKYLPSLSSNNNGSGNVLGIVTNGSSKKKESA
jgi:hypothetical protein